jgi:hypothetical protein
MAMPGLVCGGIGRLVPFGFQRPRLGIISVDFVDQLSGIGAIADLPRKHAAKRGLSRQ